MGKIIRFSSTRLKEKKNQEVEHSRPTQASNVQKLVARHRGFRVTRGESGFNVKANSQNFPPGKWKGFRSISEALEFINRKLDS